LAKYGRDLKPKIRVAKFTLDTVVFNEIELLKKNGITREVVKREMGWPINKCAIVVGHNANPHNNHMAIIQALSATKTKDFFIVIPFTYGLAPPEREAYKERLTLALKTQTAEYFFLEQYLNAIDVAKLRLASDITIHLPESDALSGSITEAMYAGSVVVTGAWLPYGPFKRAGLAFYEVEEANELPSLLDKLFNSFDSSITRHNEQKVLQNFLPEATVLKWSEIFEELA
jgi:hypothetical protein